jgi:hypothetical protein
MRGGDTTRSATWPAPVMHAASCGIRSAKPVVSCGGAIGPGISECSKLSSRSIFSWLIDVLSIVAQKFLIRGPGDVGGTIHG